VYRSLSWCYTWQEPEIQANKTPPLLPSLAAARKFYGPRFVIGISTGAVRGEMRLAILFISFIMGMFIATGHGNVGSIWPEVVVLACVLGLTAISGRSGVVSLGLLSIATFLFGFIWYTALPTWPEPLIVDGLPYDNGCSVRGRATGEAFESPGGRYVPLRIEAIRPDGYGSDGFSKVGEWREEYGIVIVETPREFVAVPGAMYTAQGRYVSEPGILQGSIFLRYRPRAVLSRLEGRSEVTLIDEPPSMIRVSNRLRYLMISHLAWGLDSAESELVAGITFGRKSRRLGGNWASDFYKSGLSHLIVASGAQISLLFLPLFFVLGRLRIRGVMKWVFLIILGLILMGFAKLLGGEPSILRAATMGCILLFAMGISKRTVGIATLSAAGFFWLIQNPQLIHDVGFLLSFAASYGIIYIGPVFTDILDAGKLPYKAAVDWSSPITAVQTEIIQSSGNLCRLLIDWTVVTFTAQIAVLPVLTCTIGRLSLTGFIANLFAVPVAQVILYLGALSGVGGFISPVVSLYLNGILKYLARALMTIANDFANLPYSGDPIEPLPGWMALIYYGVMIVLIEIWRKRNYRPIEIRHVRDMKKKTSTVKRACRGAGKIIDLDKPFPSVED